MPLLSVSQPLRRWFYRRSFEFSFNRRVYDDPVPLLHCWDEASLPMRRNWLDQQFLVIDLETSSLDPANGEIISAGWVEIRNGAMRMDTAEHWLVAAENTVGDSATVHLLRDCELLQGLSSQALMKKLLARAAGRVLVFHNATLDLAFLNSLSMHQFGAPLLLPFIDTMLLEKQKVVRSGQLLKSGILTLAGCRKRYGLPDFHGHNALLDAMATAELMLAHVACKGERVALGTLLQ